MNREKISEAMGNISFRYIEEAAVFKAEKNSHRSKSPWMKLVLAAACFCLILTAVICITMMSRDGKIISEFEVNGITDAMYPIPIAGETVFYYEVEQARKEYADREVQFLVAFKVFIGNDELSGDALHAEYQRLADLGYTLYYVEDHWTYRAGGVKEYIPIVVGLFTEAQLANFEANEMYGYSFYFETNGDGSSVTVGEREAVSKFNTAVA